VLCECPGSRRKAGENVGPLVNDTGHLATPDRENVDGLGVFFGSFSNLIFSVTSQITEPTRTLCEDWNMVGEWYT